MGALIVVMIIISVVIVIVTDWIKIGFIVYDMSDGLVVAGVMMDNVR